MITMILATVTEKLMKRSTHQRHSHSDVHRRRKEQFLKLALRQARV